MPRIFIFSKRRCLYTKFHRKSRFNLQIKHKKKKATIHDLKAKCRQLKGEKAEISKEQNSIKEAQSEVREKLKAIEMECALLQEETKFVIQRSAFTQLRLVFMFNILKARQEGDFVKAAQITQLLGEIMARDNM